MPRFQTNFDSVDGTPKWKQNRLKAIKKCINNNGLIGVEAIRHYKISLKDFEFYNADLADMRTKNFSINNHWELLKDNNQYFAKKQSKPLNNKINDNKINDALDNVEINVNKLKEIMQREMEHRIILTYASAIRHMMEHFNTFDYVVCLNNKDALHDYLFNKEHLEKGRRNLHIIKLCIKYGLIDFDKDLYNQWGKEMVEINNKEARNHVTVSKYDYDDLMKRRDDIIKDDKISEKSLIAQLYTLNTKDLFRNDDAYSILLKKGTDEENWIDLSKNELHWNYFKQSTTYKKDQKQIIKLPDDFCDNIRKSIEVYPREKLFQMTKTVFDSFFKEIFGCNVREFRKSVETWGYNNLSAREFFDNYEGSSHSVDIARRYYIDTTPVKKKLTIKLKKK
jgi:hypothetical protein